MGDISRQIASFNVAGFQYWDGPEVFSQLKIGTPLGLAAEPDNKCDSNAVALYYGKSKIGFIPAGQNALFAQMFYFGHGDALEAQVLKVDEQADPWEQVMVRIMLKDAR